jgi:hypothetical protein
MIVRVPTCGVVSVGLKVTTTLQLLPGLSFFRHCDFIANAPGVTLSIWTVRGRPVFFLPTFLIVPRQHKLDSLRRLSKRGFMAHL